MHHNNKPPKTLEEVAEEWSGDERTWTSDACVPTVDFKVSSQQEPSINLGDHQIFLDEDAIARLCAFYGIPAAFFKRLTSAERHFVMNSRIDHAEGEVTITYSPQGAIKDIFKPSQPRMEPEAFIDIARRMFGPSATVLGSWCTADDLRLDVLNGVSLSGSLTGRDFDGNITGGLRFAQNRKQNLAPTVQPILYDTATTSVIEIPDFSLRIDTRGQSIAKIADLYRAEAMRAEARIMSDIAALAALKREDISGHEVTRLHRTAEEHGLPVRPLAEITAAVSGAETSTLYDLTLAIANAANNPKLAQHGKRHTRTKLQRVAGAIVVDHVERCRACHAAVPQVA